ncbi:D-2-hydroxyacid dehydrogenase family protein [Aquabacter sp. CN5-332]|uniref:D-2-hydroxyacid dehydrogenase family protein n=1 Tax=Aquabacter sp. CN5-332 TaxID=3156608 RepID=UPI0032B4BC49
MRIAVIDDYQDAFRTLDCAARLKGQDVTVFQAPATSEAALVKMLKGFEAVILLQQRTAMPRRVLEALPDLKLISQTGRSTGHIDVAACTEVGIAVSSGGGGGPTATAELAWGLILSVARHIPAEVAALKAGRWQTTLGTGLSGKTLGIYAFGRIGSIMANVGKAFGMKVVCWGRAGSLSRAKEAGFDAAHSREAFFSLSDVVSLHLPLNTETRGIVTASDLALMKPDAILINTSRAPIIEDGALVAALRQGRPGRAGIDVYEAEPVLGGDHPLLSMSNVVCTPHLGYVERATYEALYSTAIDQIEAFAAGAPINLVTA